MSCACPGALSWYYVIAGVCNEDATTCVCVCRCSLLVSAAVYVMKARLDSTYIVRPLSPRPHLFRLIALLHTLSLLLWAYVSTCVPLFT